MTTHRAIQISILLGKSIAKAQSHAKCVSNLQRIGNTKGAEMFLSSAEQWTRIARKCQRRLAADAKRREQIKEGIRAWEEIAKSEDQMAEHYESKGDKCSETARYRADQARRVVKSFEIELQTGTAVCSCCFKPFGRGISFLQHGGLS